LIDWHSKYIYDGSVVAPYRPKESKEPPIVYNFREGTRDSGGVIKEYAAMLEEDLRKLSKTRPGDSLMITAPNASQKAVNDANLKRLEREDAGIRPYLAAQKSRDEDPLLGVTNLNSQGEERHVAILQTGFAKNASGRGDGTGWASGDGDATLDVGPTRPKGLLIIEDCLGPEAIESDSPGAKLWKSFLTYARAVSERDTSTVDRLLGTSNYAAEHSDPVKTALAEYLSRYFDVTVDEGRGLFRVDIGVHAGGKDVAVEIDRLLYGSGAGYLEVEVHRRELMKKCGWDGYIVLRSAAIYKFGAEKAFEQVKTAIEAAGIGTKPLSKEE